MRYIYGVSVCTAEVVSYINQRLEKVKIDSEDFLPSQKSSASL